LTGILGETTLKTYTIPANTIGATGAIYFLQGGTYTGAVGNKTMKVYFGASVIESHTSATMTGVYWLEGYIFNTAAGAQRCIVRFNSSAAMRDATYTATAIDTTAAVIIKTTMTLAAADTVTADMFMVELIAAP